MVINNISTIITIFTVLIMVTNGYHWLLLVVNICYNMAIGCKKWLPTIVWPIEWWTKKGYDIHLKGWNHMVAIYFVQGGAPPVMFVGL